jgi:hypothetical protein
MASSNACFRGFLLAEIGRYFQVVVNSLPAPPIAAGSELDVLADTVMCIARQGEPCSPRGSRANTRKLHDDGTDLIYTCS